MTSIAWSDLRPLNGTQHDAFEELCCQLAALEPPAAGSVFVRKAPPDAGVECYWRLPDAAEHGWQTKFFTDPLGSSQWKQLDDSVQTALAKHPQLVRYTVCIPRDREDPRRPNEEWFMDKWDAHVAKWEGWARDRGMTVAFGYWGTSEILLRLSREEHRGRTLFWFNKNLFTSSWFRERLDITLANAGPRYSANLNVELPIAQVFDGFCRAEPFLASIARARGRFARESDVTLVSDDQAVQDRARAFPQLRDRILTLLGSVGGNPPPRIPFEDVLTAAAAMRDDAWDVAEVLRGVARSEAPRAYPDRDTNTLDRLARAGDAIADLATTDAARAANARLLILRGDAGTGKTHLLCDVADARVDRGLPAVVLLGEAFTMGEPWQQIISLLGLACTPDEFLGALDAAAEVVDGCTLLALDALNESTHRPMWLSHLAGMVQTLRRYPRVRLVASVRSSYEDAVIPPQLPADETVRITHEGFSGQEYAATKAFFQHYGIALPTVPLLNPEFENPLFLKLFCEGLQRVGMTAVPRGLHGVSTVFGFFIDATNTKLAREDQLGFDVKEQLVQRAIDRVVDRMADDDVRALTRGDAKALVDAVHTAPQFERTLFRRLLTEGVLAEDRAWSEDGPVDVVRFAYERLADHLVARRLLERHVDRSAPTAAFVEAAPLGAYLRNGGVQWRTGLLAALALQLPERFGAELPDVLPEYAQTDVVHFAVIESVVWRLPTAFSDATRRYIEGELLPRREARARLLDALLTVAATAAHPYNADYLHALLLRFAMPDRDAWWSTYLFRNAGAHGAVDRLVDWARSTDDRSHIDDESTRLAATALAWFLTTSHRSLRDDATKGLVSLLTRRLTILRTILAQFRAVDDLYVRERLYAMAYGCVMRTTDDDGATKVAQQVYDESFAGTPPVHLLLRDYARGIIECALARGGTLAVDLARIQPPYGSPWPEMPTVDAVAAFGERPTDGMDEDEWARIAIHSSIMDGDFGRYIIGTNSGHFEWSPDPLNGPPVARPRERLRAFLDSLTARQRRAFDRMDEATMRDVAELLRARQPRTHPGGRDARARAERAFRKTLGRRKEAAYDVDVRRYAGRIDSEPQFDLRAAQRWVLKRVFDLGWTVQRFGRFDRRETGRGMDRRHAGKAERIGKKYQWIAWHEYLALVADNFRYADDPETRYEGPWQLFRRDIDPSVLVRRTHAQRWRAHPRTWWFPVPFTNWQEPADDVAWRESVADLPAVPPLIAVTRPDGTPSLVLASTGQWGQPQPPDEDEHELERRRITYWMASYVVRQEHHAALIAWGKDRNLHLERFPEVRYPTEAFLGEFPWARSVTTQAGAYYSRPDWTTGDHHAILPHPVLPTMDNYFWEQSGYDCSLDDTISIELPCKELIEGMELRWRGDEGKFYDAYGDLIALDPSVDERGPWALVIARDALLKYLASRGLSIVWVVFGERQVIPPDDRGMDYNELSGIYTLEGTDILGRLHSYWPGARGGD
jgi:hypothetical protein